MIQGSSVVNYPWVVLFNGTGESVGRYKKSITPQLLKCSKNAGNRPTSRHYDNGCKLHHIYHMEDLIYEVSDQASTSHKIWACWFAFTFSSAYADIMLQSE